MRRQAEALSVDEKPITITLPDGSTRPGIAGKTTPMEIAKGISAGLAKKVISPVPMPNIFSVLIVAAGHHR
jgi:hypothetical protein